MKKITIDGKRYIGLAEFDHLRYNLIRDIWESYEKDENGHRHPNDFDRGRIAGMFEIIHEVMIEDVRACESPDEIREMHKNLQREYLRGKFVIVTKDEETGERLYYRMQCEHVEEGKETPVFTNMKRLAKAFDDYYDALGWVTYLEANAGGEYTIVEACIELASPEDKERLIKMLMGDEETLRISDARDALDRISDALKKGRVALDKVERLIKDIEADGDEPEYHGDGTRAEDEDWESGADT